MLIIVCYFGLFGLRGTEVLGLGDAFGVVWWFCFVVRFVLVLGWLFVFVFSWLLVCCFDFVEWEIGFVCVIWLFALSGFVGVCWFMVVFEVVCVCLVFVFCWWCFFQVLCYF